MSSFILVIEQFFRISKLIHRTLGYFSLIVDSWNKIYVVQTQKFAGWLSLTSEILQAVDFFSMNLTFKLSSQYEVNI